MMRIAVALVYLTCGITVSMAIEQSGRHLKYHERAAVIVLWPSVIAFINVKTHMKDPNEKDSRSSQWQTAGR